MPFMIFMNSLVPNLKIPHTLCSVANSFICHLQTTTSLQNFAIILSHLFYSGFKDSLPVFSHYIYSLLHCSFLPSLSPSVPPFLPSITNDLSSLMTAIVLENAGVATCIFLHFLIFLLLITFHPMQECTVNSTASWKLFVKL